MFAASKTKQVSSAAVFVEDVMSTYLYTGNGSTQTITNGIDLSTYGGLVWVKRRNSGFGHCLADTARGGGYWIATEDAAAQAYDTTKISGFTSSGFSIGTDSRTGQNNGTYASWTFRKQPKFFDIQTFTTGDTHAGSAYTFNHNLGSAPGFVAIKCTSSSGAWFCYHISTGTTKYLLLNDSVAAGTLSTGNWASSSTTFTVPDEAFTAGTRTYVAYLFAHNAGGFGLTGTDNVISCGSYTGNGSATGPTVTLGYEPQWVLVKRTDSTSNWTLSDNMRGQPVDGATAILYPNLSDAEASATTAVSPTATGFQVKSAGTTFNASGGTYIYIAIRRGPMKTPTTGTSVFSPVTQAGSGTVTTNFPVDLSISTIKSFPQNRWAIDRLRGASGTASAYMYPNATNAEATTSGYGLAFDNNTGYKDTGVWGSGNSIIYWNFQRAPGFFDEVCRAGFDTATTHNLGVTPELIIVKNRNYSGGSPWPVYHKDLGVRKELYLNTTAAPTSFGFDMWSANASTFTYADSSSLYNYVAYLFASCPGVSKVGSYTGNGTTQTINCGFTSGARFVLIKRTDASGDWYVYDTARGMTTLTDPYLLLNSTAAESATLGSVTTVSTGFALNASILAAINTNGGSYLFWAVA